MVTISKRAVWKFFRDNVPGKRPDDSVMLLRVSYLEVAGESGVERDTLLAETNNVELIRQKMGPEFGHLQIDTLRKLVRTCCKNPNLHGGSWKATKTRNHGKKNGHIDSLDLDNSPDRENFYARIKEEDWKGLSAECKRRDGGRCRVCNTVHGLEAHHRTYDTMRTPQELSDLTTLCRQCHSMYHGTDQP